MEKQEALAWMKENERVADIYNNSYKQRRETLVRKLRLMAEQLESIDKLDYSNEAHERFMSQLFKDLSNMVDSMRDTNDNAQACEMEANRIAQLYDIVRK